MAKTTRTITSDNETWSMINDRITYLDPRYKVMDKDADIIHMIPFEMTDWDGKTVLDKVINVTGNKGTSHIERIAASLMNIKWQTVIEGDISTRDARKIEEFLEQNFLQANQYVLDTYNLAGIDPFLCKNVCNRGWIGIEWMCYIEKGEYKVHCDLLDMRWTPWVQGKWAAPIKFCDKPTIEQMMEVYAKKAEGKTTDGVYTKQTIDYNTDNEVRNYWDNDKHELLVNGKLVFKEKNVYGKYPIIIAIPPSGPMMRDTGYIQYEGESALYLIRGLIEESNRTLSVEQTFAFRQLYPGFEQETELDGSPADPAPETGETMKVRKGELHKRVETGDMNRASQVARADIFQMIDDGAPSNTATTTRQTSGRAIAAEAELMGQLHESRKLALQILREGLCRMMIDQNIVIGTMKGVGEYRIGKDGRRKSYSVSILKDPKEYDITCQAKSQNKRLEILNEARALAMWGKAPLKYILTDILQVEDVNGWIKEMELEEYDVLFPDLKMIRVGRRFAEEAEDTDNESDKAYLNVQSKLMLYQGLADLKLRMTQRSLPEETNAKAKDNSNALAASIGGSMAGGGNVYPPIP